MSNHGFYKLPHPVGHSNYFKWVLNSNDRDVFRTLCHLALTRNSTYYDEGLLIVNASVLTIALDCGLSLNSTKRALARLDKLGVIVKFKGRNRNSTYLIGFRMIYDSDRAYLLEHLVNINSAVMDNIVDDQMSELGRNAVPSIKNKNAFRLKDVYKKFILEHIKDPVDLMNSIMPNGKHVYEDLFNGNMIHKKSSLQGNVDSIFISDRRFQG